MKDVKKTVITDIKESPKKRRRLLRSLVILAVIIIAGLGAAYGTINYLGSRPTTSRSLAEESEEQVSEPFSYSGYSEEDIQTLYEYNYYLPDEYVYPTTPVIDEDGDGELWDEIPLDLDGDGSSWMTTIIRRIRTMNRSTRTEMNANTFITWQPMNI